MKRTFKTFEIFIVDSRSPVFSNRFNMHAYIHDLNRPNLFVTWKWEIKFLISQKFYNTCKVQQRELFSAGHITTLKIQKCTMDTNYDPMETCFIKILQQQFSVNYSQRPTWKAESLYITACYNSSLQDTSINDIM